MMTLHCMSNFSVLTWATIWVFSSPNWLGVRQGLVPSYASDVGQVVRGLIPVPPYTSPVGHLVRPGLGPCTSHVGHVVRPGAWFLYLHVGQVVRPGLGPCTSLYLPCGAGCQTEAWLLYLPCGVRRAWFLYLRIPPMWGLVPVPPMWGSCQTDAWCLYLLCGVLSQHLTMT